jgi:hypothetical protein
VFCIYDDVVPITETLCPSKASANKALEHVVQLIAVVLLKFEHKAQSPKSRKEVGDAWPGAHPTFEPFPSFLTDHHAHF